MQKGVYSKNWKPVTGIKLWRTSLESPLDSKEINPVNPKGNQPWIFIGRTVAKLKLQYSGHLIRRTDSLEKTWCWEDWRQEEKGATEDKMVGWHHWLNRHEFEQAPGVGVDGQGSLAWCSPWGCRVEHNWATELNWTESLFMTPWSADSIFVLVLLAVILSNSPSFGVCWFGEGIIFPRSFFFFSFPQHVPFLTIISLRPCF